MMLDVAETKRSSAASGIKSRFSGHQAQSSQYFTLMLYESKDT
jgi:hypothetical protein